MYTLVGQKCGTVLLDPRTTGVVNSEAVSRQSTITDNPVEGGGNIQDHVFCQPLTIQLQGTAINGADTIAALSAMWKKGDILTYTGRNRISNLVIQNLQSTQRAGFHGCRLVPYTGEVQPSGIADHEDQKRRPQDNRFDHDLLQRLRFLREQLQQ